MQTIHQAISEIEVQGDRYPAHTKIWLTGRSCLRPVTVLVLLLVANVDDVIAKDAGHLGAQNTVGDVLRHPAFAGFARLILPWDDRAYDEGLHWSRSDRCSPITVMSIRRRSRDGLNRMIEDASSGQNCVLPFLLRS